MSALVVYGKFIGQTSCGFVSGHTYRIKIGTCRCISPLFASKAGKWLWVFDTHSHARCPYESIKLLAENWEIPVASKADNTPPTSDNIW